eukprot:jgi/Picsp_1/576/NSC_00573-R1_---NA---
MRATRMTKNESKRNCMLLDQVMTIPGAVLQYLDSPSLEDVQAILSLYFLGFINKEEARFHFSRFGSLFVSKKSKKCELMEACRALKLDQNLKGRDLDRIKKAELIQVLEPYSLEIIPAEFIPQVQKQKEYLKRIRKVEEIVGQETLKNVLTDFYKTLSVSKQAELAVHTRPVDSVSVGLSIREANAIPALVKDPDRRCGKTLMKQLFLLSDRELGKLPYTGWERRKKFKMLEGLKLSIEKYGSWEGVQAERSKRSARRNRRRVREHEHIHRSDDEGNEHIFAVVPDRWGGYQLVLVF